MAKILVFDNYDSFTYNLVHLVEKITHRKVDIFRNDEIALEAVRKYDKIILSPGPGIPSEANLLLPLIKEYATSKSMLGVCLGHQAIAEAFGGTLENLSTVFHGVSTPLFVVKKDALLFRNIDLPMMVGRYHSWVVARQGFPPELEITSVDEAGNIMSFEHKSLDIHAVQFHPESILTAAGEQIMTNWLRL